MVLLRLATVASDSSAARTFRFEIILLILHSHMWNSVDGETTNKNVRMKTRMKIRRVIKILVRLYYCNIGGVATWQESVMRTPFF